MFELNSAEGYLLHLIKTALKGEQPKEKPNEVEWADVFRIALRQNAANLAWFSIEKLNNKPDGELYNEWQQVYAKAASKCLKQMMEIDLLSETFTSAGYDIMFLKGSKIREYYSSPDMRTMTDIDLLVKAEDRKPVREIMRSLGYEEDIMDDGQVDAFKKQPVIYTEIHYDFMYKTHRYHEFFHIDWDKLLKTDKPHIYEMTFEDLYFFNVGHYAKNMHNRGMGIRAILDCYILWNNANEEQQNSIHKKFEQTELNSFHKNLLKIANIWFNNAEDDGSLDNVQKYLIKTPTYSSRFKGDTIRLIENQVAVKSKFGFLFERIFPPCSTLYERFNVKKKCFVLLPFLWIARLFALLFSNREFKEQRKEELKIINAIDPDDVKYEILIRKEFGLIGD